MSLEEKGAAMSKKNWSNILSGLARTALAFVFVFGQSAWAIRAQNPKDKPGPGAAKSQQAQANLAAAPAAKAQSAEEGTAAAENPSAQENTHPGGQHEGIKVHGRWVVDVRNPDGTLAQHRAFENSLQPGGFAPLAALLAGNSSSAGFSIGLNMKNAVFNQGAASDGSLTARIDDFQDVNLGNGPCSLPGSTAQLGCLITTSVGPVIAISCIIGTNACSSTLNQGAPSLTANNTYQKGVAITLSGSAVAGYSASVANVETFLFTCPNSLSPQTCANNSAFGGAPTDIVMFTERDLDGLNGDATAVPVAPGQTIAVSVTISFQ
jgi:hypothetical protein